MSSLSPQTAPSPRRDRAPATARTAVVTGASSGIGAATARRLARAGAAVALLARRTGAVEAVAREITADGGTAVPVVCDVASPDDLELAARRVAQEIGTVDLLVNNAGVMHASPVADRRADQWRAMVDTNVLGVLHTTAAFLPALTAAARSGHRADIVNVSSIAGNTMFAPGFAVYNATKAAVSALSATLRSELLADGIRVTDLRPGLASTEVGRHLPQEMLDGFHEEHRALSPDEVADAILYVTRQPAHLAVPSLVVTPVTQ
ncbi:SDR family oxidoreductase [Streptomyces sp. NPDC052701]|uniref:SDR family oxidoreductase n=1 Tax=Streptomyces sp. NPDC052701 TaxID=3155533 RepID=UPI00343BB41F